MFSLINSPSISTPGCSRQFILITCFFYKRYKILDMNKLILLFWAMRRRIHFVFGWDFLVELYICSILLGHLLKMGKNYYLPSFAIKINKICAIVFEKGTTRIKSWITEFFNFVFILIEYLWFWILFKIVFS